jgi:hypothetical protein
MSWCSRSFRAYRLAIPGSSARFLRRKITSNANSQKWGRPPFPAHCWWSGSWRSAECAGCGVLPPYASRRHQPIAARSRRLRTPRLFYARNQHCHAPSKFLAPDPLVLILQVTAWGDVPIPRWCIIAICYNHPSCTSFPGEHWQTSGQSIRLPRDRWPHGTK